MSDIEKRVRTEVARIITNASNFPQPMQVHMWGRDLSEPIDKLTEALIPLIREAQAEALREAADKFQSGDWFNVIEGNAHVKIGNGQRVTDWLRARAEKLATK